ncbi:MAG TPA: phosphate acyltransferase [Gemmatimonadales bacterium]|nr:phosphate acyltransferase [Gemmatimonadales bacterium]
MSLDGLLARAAPCAARLLLTGGDQELLVQAASQLAGAGLARVQVIGSGGATPETHPRLEAVATLLRARAPERVRDAIHALDLAADPLRFALGLLALGDADCVVAGPGISIAELVEATVWTLGQPDGEGFRFAGWLALGDGRLVGFADCVDAAPLDAASRERLARSMEGLQAAVSSAPASVALLPGFRGEDNVLIFPDGAAGALALGIARRLAGASQLGPLLLGGRGVVSGVAPDGDLEELVGTAAATVLAAGRAGN